ncbi:MAG: 50S ribosomal protein L15 [Deltaproteobacteria bacterium]|nr:50S ribosomal protein L15 [Deltaproteobacteria bacterium]
MLLENLKVPYGSVKNRMRVGRGNASGNGTTCGRGMKGQKARSGGKIPPYFEGGQMPLQRRLPKFGFTGAVHKKSAIFNIGDIERFKLGDNVNLDLLKNKGLIPKKSLTLKILAKGKLTKPVTIVAHHFSAEALKVVEKAGGKIIPVKAEK